MLIGFFFFCLVILKGSTGSATPKAPEVAFTVQGNEIQYEPKKNRSDVVGNARATRTLSPKAVSQEPRRQTLTADRFHVNFVNSDEATDRSKSSQNINTITAEGNVTFYEGDLKIQAASCVYNCKSNTIICEGNIVLTKEQNTLQGDKAEANLESGCYTVTVHNTADRVQAVLQSSCARH